MADKIMYIASFDVCCLGMCTKRLGTETLKPKNILKKGCVVFDTIDFEIIMLFFY